MKKLVIVLLTVFLIGCNEATCEKLDYEKTLVENESILLSIDEYSDSELYDLNTELEGYKVYQVSETYDILFVKGDLVFQMPCGYLDQIYLIDSNNDGINEMLTVGSIGSGLLIIRISHFDPSTKEITVGHFYNDNDGISIDVLDGKLVAYTEYSFKRASDPFGEITFGDTVGIEGMVDHLEKDH